LLLGQILSSCTAIFFIIESIYLRNLNEINKSKKNNFIKKNSKILFKDNINNEKILIKYKNHTYNSNNIDLKKINQLNFINYTQPLDY
jgi:hypothetical protein